MTPSQHFARLLRASFLSQEIKDWIIANIEKIPMDKLEALYALLQEEDARVQKALLEMEMGR